MKPLRGAVTERLRASPDEVFDLISNVQRLPEWNEHIHHVVEAPAGPTSAGDEWVVEIRALASRWNSRSRIEMIDREARRLGLVSQTDDGNPSRARWVWEVTPAAGGAEVVVRWEISPKTFWRKVLLSKIRHRQLKQEVRTSLKRLSNVAARAAKASPTF